MGAGAIGSKAALDKARAKWGIRAAIWIRPDGIRCVGTSWSVSGWTCNRAKGRGKTWKAAFEAADKKGGKTTATGGENVEG